MAQRISRRKFLKYAGLAGASVLGGSTLATQCGAATPAPVVKTAEKPIKIGGVFTMSGPVGAWGEAGRQGTLLAIEEINQAGGILGRPVEAYFEDDEANAEVGVRKVRKLVLETGVDLLMGINSSGVALAVCPVLPELKTILMIPCAASPRITNQAFNRYVFRQHANSNQIGMAGAFLARDLPARKWTVIGPDYVYGWDSWGSFISKLITMRPDIEVMEVQAWPPLLSGEYESHITKILDARPEAVYSPLWGGDMVAFVKQAVAAKFFDQVQAFLTPAGLSLDVFYALGGAMPEGLYSAAHGYWFEHPVRPQNQEFVQKFVDRFGKYPHVVSHDQYAGLYLYKAAVEKAGKVDADAIIEAMEGMEFDSPAYKRKIRKEDHQVITDVPWGRSAKAEGLVGLPKHLTDIKDSPGDELIQPLEEVLASRANPDAQPAYMQYVHK